MSSSRLTNKLANWGCGLFILAVLIALLWPAVQVAPTPAKRTQCRNNLKQISLALHNYEHQYGCFPPAFVADEGGRPLHSWRVLILPYLDYANLYNKYRFYEPWDGPNNSKLAIERIPVYECPTDVENRDGDHVWTSYVAVIGPHTMWPDSNSVSVSDVVDGTDVTLHVAETRNSGIHWMEPRDLYLGQMAPTINPPAGQGISSFHKDGTHASLVDGSVRFFSDTLSADTVRQLIDRDDGGPAEQTIP